MPKGKNKKQVATPKKRATSQRKRDISAQSDTQELYAFSEFKQAIAELLSSFRDPFAWFILLAIFVLSIIASEMLGSLQHQEPLFSFLKAPLESIGGIFGYKMSGYRYVRRVPAVVYQLLLPLFFTWVVFYFRQQKNRRKLITALLDGGRFCGLVWKGLAKWRRTIVYLLLLLLPFIYFFASSASFKRNYPSLAELRKRRVVMEHGSTALQSSLRQQKIASLQKELDLLSKDVSQKKGDSSQKKQLFWQKLQQIDKLVNWKAGWFFSVVWLFLLFELLRFCYMLSWEFFFRGWLLSWLREKFGYYAVLLQVLPYVLLHSISRSVELYVSIPGGLLLGVVAYHTKSIWPGLFLYFGATFFFDFFALFF